MELTATERTRLEPGRVAGFLTICESTMLREPERRFSAKGRSQNFPPGSAGALISGNSPRGEFGFETASIRHGLRLRPGAARDRAGVMLVEMLIAMSLLAVLIAAGTQLLASMLESERSVRDEIGLHPEAQRALESMAEAVAGTTHLHIPNGRCRTTSRLVLSANVDDDEDGRVDEDPSANLFGSAHGAAGMDDDCDGLVDESLSEDDDEDGLANEDPRDGTDNDGDGSIDEDPAADANGDGWAGVRRFDDDGDGTRDEGPSADDDEDGHSNEDGADLRVFWFDAGNRVLYEQRPGDDRFVLLELRLRVGDGSPQDDIVLTTRVCPANQTAKHGLTTS